MTLRGSYDLSDDGPSMITLSSECSMTRQARYHYFNSCKACCMNIKMKADNECGGGEPFDKTHSPYTAVSSHIEPP